MDTTDKDLEKAIVDTKDQIVLFQDLLAPLTRSMISSCEHIYAPRCIGILSRWPWLNTLTDWLRELIFISRNPCENHVPIERYAHIRLCTDTWFISWKKCLYRLLEN